MISIRLLHVLAITYYSASFGCASNSTISQGDNDQSRVYQLSEDELVAYERIKGSQVKYDAAHEPVSHSFDKRGVASAITCFNLNTMVVKYHWLTAQCDDAFWRSTFQVTCLVTYFDWQTEQYLHELRQVKGSCGHLQFCVDIDAKYNGEGHMTMPNDVDCRSRSINREWEKKIMAIELNRLIELNRCSKPWTVPGSSSDGASTSHGTKRGRERSHSPTYWSVQMEVGLTTGEDYHAKRLYINDVTFSVPKEVKSRPDANVTHVEVTMFPELGIHSRNFEFCVNTAKTTPETQNKWIFVYHSIRDMDDDQGFGRIGHGSRKRTVEYRHESKQSAGVTYDGSLE